MEGTGLYVCGEGVRGNVAGGCRVDYTAELIRSLAARLRQAEKERDNLRLDAESRDQDKADLRKNLQRAEQALHTIAIYPVGAIQNRENLEAVKGIARAALDAAKQPERNP
jgi:predicted GTPase